MRVAVTDASIFIDLIDLGWIRLLPQLDCEIVTTYNILVVAALSFALFEQAVLG